MLDARICIDRPTCIGCVGSFGNTVEHQGLHHVLVFRDSICQRLWVLDETVALGREAYSRQARCRHRLVLQCHGNDLQVDATVLRVRVERPFSCCMIRYSENPLDRRLDRPPILNVQFDVATAPELIDHGLKRKGERSFGSVEFIFSIACA